MGGEPNPRKTPDTADDRTLPGDDGWPVPEQYRVESTPAAPVEEVDGDTVVLQSAPPVEAAPPVRRFPPDLGPGLLAALVGVLLVVLLIPAGIWLAQRSDDDSGSTTGTSTQPTAPTTPLAARTVPDVVGLRLPEARAQLGESSLDVRVSRVASEQPRDEVLRQQPAADAEPPPNGIVVLTVSDGPSDVVLPRVEGLTIVQATRTLEDAGLRVEVRRVDSTEPEGAVVGQTPSAGETVDRESVVVLEVARQATETTDTTTTTTTTPPEPATVTVPNLVGVTSAQARARLSDLGLRYTQRPLTSSQPKGTVVRQSPSAGAKVREGGTVTLTVSTGPATIEVPDVVGLDEVTARSELEAAGFRVETVEEPTAEPTDDGIVLRQSPRGGASRATGSVVTVTVARFE
jgi:beta-lactam-binding protein with PASTA domain